MTTWLRLQKVLEGQQAAAVVTGTVPMSRSAGGVSMVLTRVGTGGRGLGAGGTSFDSPPSRLAQDNPGSQPAGIEVRIQRARLVPGMGAPVRLTARALVA